MKQVWRKILKKSMNVCRFFFFFFLEDIYVNSCQLLKHLLIFHIDKLRII